MYQAALDIRQVVFGGKNLHVAIAHEDLAYSSYVHEYSTGKFTDARYVREIQQLYTTKVSNLSKQVTSMMVRCNAAFGCFLSLFYQKEAKDIKRHREEKCEKKTRPRQY